MYYTIEIDKVAQGILFIAVSLKLAMFLLAIWHNLKI